MDVNYQFEASSYHFDRRHLGLLEPEVTIFGREGGAEQTLCYQLTLALAQLARCIRNSLYINQDAKNRLKT